MFENDVFDVWLDNKSKEIILKLDKEKLSSEEMIILMLKAQTNHFAHLDIDLRSDMSSMNERLSNDIKTVNERLSNDIKAVNERIEQSTKEWREEMLALRKDMDKRFEALTTRIDRFMIWSFTTSLAIGAAVVAAIRYLPAVQ